MERVLEALNLCREEECDTHRKWMQAPFKVGNFVAATDGDTIAAVHSEFINGEYPEIEETPALVLLEHLTKEQNCLTEISAKVLKEALTAIKTIDQYDTYPCRDCDGEGSVECNLGHDHDCDSCGGEGKISKDTPNGKKDFPRFSIFKINHHFIAANFLERVSLAAELLEKETIHLVFEGEPTKPLIFRVGQLLIVILPLASIDTYYGVTTLLENGILSTSKTPEL